MDLEHHHRRLDSALDVGPNVRVVVTLISRAEDLRRGLFLNDDVQTFKNGTTANAMLCGKSTFGRRLPRICKRYNHRLRGGRSGNARRGEGAFPIREIR